MDKQRITEVIYLAIDEVNEGLPAEHKLTKTPATVLFGSDGSLDSLGLVNLITVTEQRVEDAFGKTITLADERALSAEESPFKTVSTLTDYIAAILGEVPAAG